MGYYIDLKAIGIDEYREKLRTADLLPSHLVLKTDLDGNFDLIKAQNISSIEELRVALRSKQKQEDFSKRTGIALDYLKILIRNINGYRQKPNLIKDFPNISDDLVRKLENLGIKNTLHIYERILTKNGRKDLSTLSGIAEGDVLRLAKLADLCRIRWVNHTFAYLLVKAGYDTAEKAATADYQEMYERVKKLNQERQIFKGQIGPHDMKLTVEAAQALPMDIEY